MRFKVFSTLLLLAAFFSLNCSYIFSKPSDTVNEFSTRLKNKDVENLGELFSEKFKKTSGVDFSNPIKRNINDEKALNAPPHLFSFEIESEEIISDRASVTTKSISESGGIVKTVFVLVKENGEWKIESFQADLI